MSKYTRPDEELVELLWQDGNVFMHKQTKHRSTLTSEPYRNHPFRCERTFSKLNDSIPDEVTTPWFQHNLDTILETDLCTEFFYGVPNADGINAMEEEGCVKLVPEKETSTYNCLLTGDNIFPTKSQAFSLVPNASVFMNSNCPASPMKIDTSSKTKQNNEKTAMNSNQKVVGQSSSTMTKMSSRCSSNHIAIQREQSQAPRNNASISREATNSLTTSTQTQRHVTAPTITSSSGGSGSTIGKTIHRKRKRMETNDTEFQSEDGEDYSVEPSKQHQRSASTRRSRSADVHNLSERKRRDRINEKLKALQDLIPHCTKTDKASVLDEAIEYLKSLQMQLQIMWMGSGMAQMMLPNLQHYFPSLSMGIAHGSMPPMPGSIQMQRVPMFNPHVSSVDAMNQAFPTMAPVGNIPQMPNVGNTDVYSRYLGHLHMQPTLKFNQSTDSVAQ